MNNNFDISRLQLLSARVLPLVFILILNSCSGSGGSTDGNVASTDTAASVIADDAALTGDDSSSATDQSADSVPDPLIQNSTRVTFDVQVPAIQSDALQLNLAWGDQEFFADWVGDEFWAAVADLPTRTESQLSVTFFDRNGEITLASFETDFVTGTNTSESLRITVDQFDSGRWDDDGDGISNLDELIDGTYTSGLRVLLFSETQGFRHDSIPAALSALEELAATAGIDTVRADDSTGIFTQSNLANYDAVVWALTSGDVLDEQEQAAFEAYIAAGGGYAGIHAASDTEYNWPWYGGLVGAYFARHPEIQTATQIVENGTHPSTAHLESIWTRTDEWYDFQSNPRGRVNVLLTLDESTYNGGGMGADHPIAWYHEYMGGRSWYTGGGHTTQSYSEPDFRAHLLGGLSYAIGLDQ